MKQTGFKNLTSTIALTSVSFMFLVILSGLSVSVYANTNTSANTDENNIDCESPMTTADMNYCARQNVLTAEDTMNTYLIATINANRYDEETVEAIMKSQTDWQDYRDSYCGAVYSHWREGTIRGLMSISCELELTEQRTHQLWQDFLTFMDSTEPVLPKPTDFNSDK